MQRWIPVPKTLAFIENRDQLFQFDFDSLWRSRFVAKPNQWSQWKWIYLVKDFVEESTDEASLKEEEQSKIPSFIQPLPKVFHTLYRWCFDFYYSFVVAYIPFFPYRYRVSGQRINDRTFKSNLVHILDGQYKLWNKPDNILVEELIEAGEWFEAFCEWGLADIRIIVFNLVPIAAMVRVPTEKSDGKANLAQWWIALGIDIGTGRISSVAWKWAGKSYTKAFPEEYKHFKWMKVPFWDDLMLLSANVQFFVNIGYVGLDWVITKSWPKLLEVNWRSGIEIQNITMQPMLSRIQKIEDIHITTPTKGVEIAKSLFSEHKIPHQSKTIYLSQKAIVSDLDKDDVVKFEVIATSSIKKKKNYASKAVMEKLTKWNVSLFLPDSDVKSNISLLSSRKIQGNQIILWTSFLENYVLKPEHKSHPNLSFISEKNIVESEIQDLQILDQNINTLYKRIPLRRVLFPTNYLSELDTFVSKKGDYNPVFTYRYPTDERIADLKEQIERLYTYHNGWTLLKSSFATLLYDKLAELNVKLSLLEAYKKQDLKKIAQYNRKFYGAIDDELLTLAEEKIYNHVAWHKRQLGKLRNMTDTIKYIRKYLRDRDIRDVPVLKSMGSVSRISISYPKQRPTIRLSGTWNWRFRQIELEAKMAHEVDVHLMRHINWRRSGWHIMSIGTAWYISDEEGLAIHHANELYKKYLPHYENISIYQKYLYVQKAQNLSFKDIVSLIADEDGSDHSLRGLFLSAMRFKKGTQYTKIAHPWTIFIKDKVYLEWYLKIQKYLADWGVIDKRLMSWKIKVEDVDLIY